MMLIFYDGFRTAITRTVKNMGIALIARKNFSYFFSNLWLFLSLFLFRKPGYYISKLSQLLYDKNVSSTFFLLVNKKHRRDGNYEPESLQEEVEKSQNLGFDFGLHGSYTSIIEENCLETESKKFNAIFKNLPTGSRQHWLRFDSYKKLNNNIQKADIDFDSSIGFSNRLGFRTGLSCAYPPYDFENEIPHSFLEIPLVVMDSAIAASQYNNPSEAEKAVNEILDQSSKWGWGGIAILWHDPLEPLAVPKEINAIFWNAIQSRVGAQERWVSGADFLSIASQSYQNAGLPISKGENL